MDVTGHMEETLALLEVRPPPLAPLLPAALAALVAVVCA